MADSTWWETSVKEICSDSEMRQQQAAAAGGFWGGSRDTNASTTTQPQLEPLLPMEATHPSITSTLGMDFLCFPISLVA